MNDTEFGKCESCGTPLLQKDGFFGTSLCGPCCTGEASTLGKVSWECKKCDGSKEISVGLTPGPCSCGETLVLSHLKN